MNEVKIWAPAAKKVEIKIDKDTALMNSVEDGWWSAKAPDHAFYSLVIDGEAPPVPDPRSPWQPEGVHGASQLVDQTRFPWTDQRWQAPPLASAVIYELHIGTFTPAGTFLSAIERLDHLVSLGITHVELMPVNEFPGEVGWGYDGVDFYAPFHGYGKPDDLKRFVDACHAKGLAVLLDVVYNHLGPVGNYLSRFGPYQNERTSTTWGSPLNYDGPQSEQVRRFAIDNALMWLRDYHFDGLRLDAIHAIVDTSAVHLLEQMSTEVEELESILGRHLVLIAESDLNDPRVVNSREAGGYGIDAQWSDDFHHSLHTILTGESNGYYSDFGSFADLAKAFQEVFVYDGQFSKHRERRHGRPAGNLPGGRFLAYLQNHDQIGNRAQGERSAHLMNKGRLKIGAALVLLSPYVPMLFQGEEWAASSPFQYFTRHEEESQARAVTEGRTREFVAFGWKPEEVPDPQAEETFERSKLKWEERKESFHAEMLEWHRKLIALRRETPDLRNGRRDEVEVRFDENARWFSVTRGEITATCNLGENSFCFPLQGAHELLLASDQAVCVHKNCITLPPDSVAVLKRKEKTV